MTSIRPLKDLVAEELNIGSACSLPDDLFAFVLERQGWTWAQHIKRGHDGRGYQPPSARADMSILSLRGYDASVRLISLRMHQYVCLSIAELDEIRKEAERQSITGGCFLTSGKGRYFRDCPIFAFAGYEIRVCVHTRLSME